MPSAIPRSFVRQRKGDYYCDSITVNFGDDIWENAIALNSTGGVEEYDLIYSYFNGVYEKNSTDADGRPIYTEQSKVDDQGYMVTTGATIKYCKDERAWGFMHEHIRKDINTQNSDCPWLLRSPETFSFNLLDVSGDWSIWTGTINNGATFQTSCNECDSGSETDCNYHGKCGTDRRCECDLGDDGYKLYTGIHCEHSRPCARLRGDRGDIWNIHLLDNKHAWRSYGRGVYNLVSGVDVTVPKNDSMVLIFTGSRWFYSIFEGGKAKGDDYWVQESLEMHAFWGRLYKDNTYAVSNPTYRSDPIAVDFFEIGRRGEKYGPLGELIPYANYSGSGYFECAMNSSLTDLLQDILETQNKTY